MEGTAAMPPFYELHLISLACPCVIEMAFLESSL